MTNNDIQLPWDDPDWINQVTIWLHDQLAANDRQVTGPVEILHQRAWSTFIQVETDKGIVFFKAPAPTDQHEAMLTQTLARQYPDCTVPVLAIDAERNWLLTEKAGDTLRSVTRSPDQIEHWLKLIPSYIELQMDMTERVPELLALGMPDRRLSVLPQLYIELLEDSENLRVGLKPGLTQEEFEHLKAMQSDFVIGCQRLADYGIPDTLTHEELHEANVIFGDGHYRFTDWSDSGISHPFFTLFITMRTIVHWLKMDETSKEVIRVRDVFLEPFTRYMSRDNLVEAYQLACRLAMVNRAISWQLGTGALPMKYKEPYIDSVPEWLQDFLADETPLT